MYAMHLPRLWSDQYKKYIKHNCTCVDLWHLGVMDSLLHVSTETVSPKGTFCDTVQVPSGADDLELI